MITDNVKAWRSIDNQGAFLFDTGLDHGGRDFL